jgi:RNA polymerase sigma-70 factor, ECF subfamily
LLTLRPAPGLEERITTTVIARQDEFERAAMPHARSLLRVARRLAADGSAAEDLVQETLLRAWRSFHQFQSGTNTRAWLFRILFNAFYAHGRKLRSAPVLVPLPTPGGGAESDTAPTISPLEATAILRALGELSAEHGSVLLLVVVEGFTCREAAEILALPIGTVMSRLSRARGALRDRLEGGPHNLRAARAGTEYLEKEAS